MNATHAPARLRHELVKDVMSGQVLTIEVNESLWDAWQLLFVSGLRHLVVLDDNGACLGVLSDRSVLAEVPATPEHLSQRHVRDILARVPVVSVCPDDDPHVAGKLMIAHAVEAIPVVNEAGRVVGMVTEADLIRWIVG